MKILIAIICGVVGYWTAYNAVMEGYNFFEILILLAAMLLVTSWAGAMLFSLFKGLKERKISAKAKKIGAIICAAIVLLVGAGGIAKLSYNNNYDSYADNYIAEASANGTLKLKVTIKSKRVAYYHLGTDITISHTLNGKPIKSGDVIPYAYQLDFFTTIIEHDGEDDVGTTTNTFIIPTNITHSYKVTRTLRIRVDESGGKRYPDAYATYDVTYSVKPVVKAKFWDVVFYKG